MLNVLFAAISQCSLLNERAVDWDQRPVTSPALAAKMNLSRRNFLVAGACASGCSRTEGGAGSREASGRNTAATMPAFGSRCPARKNKSAERRPQGQLDNINRRPGALSE